MSARLVVGAIAFCVAMTGIILFNLFLATMIGDINCKRRGDDLISYHWLTLPKILRIFEEYRRLYPDEKYADYTLAAIVSVAIGVLIALFSLASIR
jgi:hypothetical protein